MEMDLKRLQHLRHLANLLTWQVAGCLLMALGLFRVVSRLGGYLRKDCTSHMVSLMLSALLASSANCSLSLADRV